MSVYIIAECGQNHNGRLDYAERLIDLAAQPIIHEGKELKGADSVKFCKRDLSEEITVDEWNRPYTGPHSFGATYGEHRQALELDYNAHAYLYDYAKVKGLEFVETLCSPKAVEGIFKLFTPDKVKVASRDITNIPLLEAIRDTGHKSIILSDGMDGGNDIEAAMGILGYQNIFSILYCVSEYPTRYEYLDFSGELFGGFSDHTNGILAPSIAVACGARVIEKHITFDKSLKGADHAGSMDAEGFYRVVRDIRNTEIMLMPKGAKPSSNKSKLMRSMAYRRDMKAGDIFTKADLVMLSPGTGEPYNENYFGRELLIDVKANTHLKGGDFLCIL